VQARSTSGRAGQSLPPDGDKASSLSVKMEPTEGVEPQPAVYKIIGVASSPLPYPDDNYLATTSATFAELTADPGAIVERLFGRLNRTLTHRSMSFRAPDLAQQRKL
jgi:hypothetical protein